MSILGAKGFYRSRATASRPKATKRYGDAILATRMSTSQTSSGRVSRFLKTLSGLDPMENAIILALAVIFIAFTWSVFTFKGSWQNFWMPRAEGAMDEGNPLHGMEWDGVARTCGEQHLPCAYLIKGDDLLLVIFNEIGTEAEVIFKWSGENRGEVVYRRPARNPKTREYPQKR